jgi:hypothetical protein
LGARWLQTAVKCTEIVALKWNGDIAPNSQCAKHEDRDPTNPQNSAVRRRVVTADHSTKISICAGRSSRVPPATCIPPARAPSASGRPPRSDYSRAGNDYRVAPRHILTLPVFPQARHSRGRLRQINKHLRGYALYGPFNDGGSPPDG